MKLQIYLLLIVALLFCNKSDAQNLIASYPLNGNANDVSGNANNGTIIGNPAFVADRFGNASSAIAFTGDLTQRIEINDNALLHTPSISIAAWVRVTGFNVTLKTIVDKPLGTGNSDSWHLGIITNGGYMYSSWFFNDPGATTGSQITASANLSEWHYVVATFDNNSKLHKLYVDGILSSTNTFNSTIGYDNSKMYIGTALENNALNFPMDGVLDDIKIFDGALTAQQIANEYSAGIPYNNPGSGNSIYFNGSNNNYAQLPPLLDGTNIFTVDFWVKTTDNNSNPIYWLKPTLVGNANPSSQDGDFGITLNNGQIGVWSGISSSGDNELQTTKTINDDKWHHVAVVSDGANMVLYVDGMLLPGSISTAGGTLQTVARPWRIGMNNSCCSNGYPINAAIDEFRVWNTALTQTQIRDRMCRKINNSDALFNNLVANYHFNETIGAAIVDSKNNNNGYFNDGTRIISGAPVGDASAHDYINATKTASISHSTGESFTVTSSSGNPDGIQIYRVDEQPNTLNGTISLGSMNKYFGVFQVNGSSPEYNAVYNYTGNPDVTSANENTLSLYKRNDNSFAIWANSNAILNTTTKTCTVTGQSTEYILGISGTLPLRLLLFTAVKQSTNVLLQWQTTDEINTSYFDIEFSNDGSTYTKIGETRVANTSGKHSYSFVHQSPEDGTLYYRLRQVDKDGHYQYSAVRLLKMNQDLKVKVIIYPNPATSNIMLRNICADDINAVQIITADGKIVLQQKANPTMIYNIDGLKKGSYFIKIINKSGAIETRAFVKQ